MKNKNNVILKMKCIEDKIRQMGDVVFSSYDLTGSQVGYMSYIRASGGSISQKELEIKANVSHPTIVGVVSRLQKKGFVTVHVDANDRRKRIIQLTDKAKDVTDELKKGQENLNDTLLNGISSEEIEELSRLLNIIYENVCEKLNGKESD